MKKKMIVVNMVLGAYQSGAFYGSPLYGGPPGLALKSWTRVDVTDSGKDSSLLLKAPGLVQKLVELLYLREFLITVVIIII